MKVIIEAEPKEIADLVGALQGPPMVRIKEPDSSEIADLVGKLKGLPIVRIKEPDSSTVMKDFLTAIDDRLQAGQA